jgi:hypothetical protein
MSNGTTGTSTSGSANAGGSLSGSTNCGALGDQRDTQSQSLDR